MLGAVACSVFFGYLINQIPSLNDLPIFRDLPIFNKKNIFLTTITTTLLLGLIGLSLTASIEKIQKLIQDQSTYNSENKLDLGRRMRIIKTHLDNVEKRLKDIVLIHISVSDVGELLGENRSPLEVLKQAEVVKLSETVFKRVVRWITFDKKREKIFEKQVQMIEVFRHEEINGRLLIVGSAGSGKTTMLLKLAKELLIEAKSSESKTIPHVFELSGWVTGQSLCKYLAGELKRIHNLDESIGIVLLESGKILPLLDGLDELRDLGRIREGMREINSFLADSHGNRKIVVCCRIKDYELAQQQLEKLNGAVQLQSLTDDDIKMYLTLLGKNNLWQVIEHNPMLLNGTDTENMMPPLLRTPLFLSIFTEVYQAGKINSVADLWNSYIKKQLEIPANNLPTKGYKRYEPREIPSNKQIQYYLVFLAKQLVGSKPEFLIEEIQPVWLLDNRKKLKMQLILSIVLGVVSTATTATTAITSTTSTT